MQEVRDHEDMYDGEGYDVDNETSMMYSRVKRPSTKDF